MRFWETSALIPLCVAESTSAVARQLLEADPEMAVWWATPVECASALARRRREAAVSPEEETHASAVVARLAAAWFVIAAGSQVLDRATRLVRTHPLRAADALQLAAALVWADEAPVSRELVTLDQRLREAALREGFTVLPETP